MARYGTTHTSIIDIDHMTHNIHITNIACQASIGVIEWEKTIQQNLRIDIDIHALIPNAAHTDALEDTVDYKELTSIVIDHCQSKHFGLIELLVEELSHLVLQYDTRIVELRIQVHKVGALRHAQQVSVATHVYNSQVIVGVGSNLEPHTNIPLAIEKLARCFGDLTRASVLSTKAVARPHDPDFLNTAVGFRSALSTKVLERRLKHIEYEMGRERGNSDAFSPRIIDLDLILFNDVITDGDIFDRDFLQQLIEEISPGMLQLLKKNYALPIL